MPSKWMNAIVVRRCSGARVFEQRLAQPDRYALLQIHVVRGWRHLVPGRGRAERGGPPEQDPRALGPTQHRRPKGSSHVRTDEDLPRVGSAFEARRLAGSRSGDDEFAVGGADEEEVERPRVGTDRHAEAHLLSEHAELATLSQGAAHPHCRPRGPGGMVVPVEEQQERIAAELEEATAVVVRHRQQLREGRADRCRQLLGTDVPLPGQTLGEFGETRDVDEDNAAVERPGERRRVGPEPLRHQPREIGSEPLVRVRGQTHHHRVSHASPRHPSPRPTVGNAVNRSRSHLRRGPARRPGSRRRSPTRDRFAVPLAPRRTA